LSNFFLYIYIYNLELNNSSECELPQYPSSPDLQVKMNLTIKNSKLAVPTAAAAATTIASSNQNHSLIKQQFSLDETTPPPHHILFPFQSYPCSSNSLMENQNYSVLHPANMYTEKMINANTNNNNSVNSSKRESPTSNSHNNSSDKINNSDTSNSNNSSINSNNSSSNLNSNKHFY
jgi:hypothetical protein